MIVEFYLFQTILKLLNFEYCAHQVLCNKDTPDDNILQCIYNKNIYFNENVEHSVEGKLFDLKDDIIQKFDNISRIDYDIKESVDKINTNTIINQISDKTDKASKENDVVLKSIEVINSRMAEMEKEFQNSINTKFQRLENDIDKKITKLADTMNILLATNTKLITDKIDLTSKEKTVNEATETIYNRLLVLEYKLNHQDNLTKKLLNTSEIMLESQRQLMESQVKPRQNSQNTIENNVTDIKHDVIHSLCNFTVPSSIKIKKDVFLMSQAPAQDDLDIFIVKKTGCKYQGIMPFGGMDLAGVSYNGTQVELYVAVRANDKAYMDLGWGNPAGDYGFLVGDDENKITRVLQYEPTYHGLSRNSTPGILSSDRYVPFYFKIHNGILTFGKECASEPLFTGNITINGGQKVQLTLRTHSHYGAKYLYDCPATFADLA